MRGFVDKSRSVVRRVGEIMVWMKDGFAPSQNDVVYIAELCTGKRGAGPWSEALKRASGHLSVVIDASRRTNGQWAADDSAREHWRQAREEMERFASKGSPLDSPAFKVLWS